jgi:ribonucleoside-diphosphate reductase alpha subunit
MELIVKKRNGNTENFNVKKIRSLIDKICDGVEDVCAANITNEVIPQLYNGITTDEILKLLVLTTKAKIEEDPNYSYVAARFLLSKIYKEAGVQTQSSYKRMFVSNTQRLVTAGRLDERILLLDLDKLSQYLRPERDLKFKYLGLQTLYDRYFIHIKKQRLETPQAFWMRVAIGVSLREDKPEDWAIKFYDVMSQFLYCPGSPTLFHSGTPAPQLSSCFLTTIDDSIDGIFGTMHDQARLSKYAGGLGIDVTPLRGTNSHIKGTNGESSGLIPWLKDYDTMLVSVNQSGKRRGSGGFYLEPWHIDIEDFIDIKEHGGDEYRRCHNINTALWIPDAFMEAVESNNDWFLFSPDEVPGLHDSYGEAFDKLYESYKEKALTGQLLQYRVVKAKELAKKILRAVFETGHPWLCFKDPSNLRYMQQDEGVIYSSNLCTEVFRHSIATMYDRWGLKAQPGEVAVCTIGSTNLSEHVEDGEIDFDKLQRSLFIGNRILDNVIDENYYPIPETAISHMKHRPVGMGLMGFADTLHKLEIPYASNEAVELAGTVQEFICYNMIQSSIELAKERGPFPSFDNSEWAKGKLPFDSYEAIASRRKNALPLKLKICQDSWDDLREDLLDYGIRNASLMAIAPTACVTGDTYILSNQGLLPISKLGNIYGTQWQDIDIKVKQDSGIETANKFYINGPQQVIKITTKRGHEIKCTENHKIRAIDENGNYIWKYARDIKESDYVAINIGGHENLLGNKELVHLYPDTTHIHNQENKCFLPTELNEDLAELLGYYQGDGYLRDRDLGIIVSNIDEDLINYWTEFFNKIGLKPTIEERKTSVKVMHIFSKRLERWFEINNLRKPQGNKGEGSFGAFIPEVVLRSKTSILKAFLRGLFEAEGTINFQKSGSPTVEMSTVSEKLAKSVHYSLESLGIKSSLVKVRPGTFGSKPVFRVRPSTVEDVKLFLKDIGFISERKKQKSQVALDYTCNFNEYINIKHKELIVEFVESARFAKVEKKQQLRLNTAKQQNCLNLRLASKMIDTYPSLLKTKLGNLTKNSNIDLVQVKNVTFDSIENTYDMSVPSNNTYIANSFVSHNTISYITGCSQSGEPDFSMLHVYSTMSGDFTMINEFFVAKCKELGIWGQELREALKRVDGEITKLKLPPELKRQFLSAFEIPYEFIIDATAKRQQFTDMGISMNLYCDIPSMFYLYKMYEHAYQRGLKSTYYLRSKGISKVEKSSVTQSSETCRFDGGCEVCQ